LKAFKSIYFLFETIKEFFILHQSATSFLHKNPPQMPFFAKLQKNLPYSQEHGRLFIYHFSFII